MLIHLKDGAGHGGLRTEVEWHFVVIRKFATCELHGASHLGTSKPNLSALERRHSKVHPCSEHHLLVYSMRYRLTKHRLQH